MTVTPVSSTKCQVSLKESPSILFRIPISQETKNVSFINKRQYKSEIMIIAWFSCGATSAVACKIALNMYKDVQIYYIETGSGHQDNARFISDCEKWYGQPIHIIRNKKYKDVPEVLRLGYINGPNGAACTLRLKKNVRYDLEKTLVDWGGQIWGFEFDKKEINRAIRFKQQYPETKPLFPLIEKRITKSDALAMILKAGIEIPEMYKMGYNNNNCIPCVKGGIGYWNKIRKDFPDKFNEIAAIEREIGASCLKDKNGQLYLDKLDPNRGWKVKEITHDCSIVCEIEFQEIIDKQVDQIFDGEISINDAI